MLLISRLSNYMYLNQKYFVPKCQTIDPIYVTKKTLSVVKQYKYVSYANFAPTVLSSIDVFHS